MRGVDHRQWPGLPHFLKQHFVLLLSRQNMTSLSRGTVDSNQEDISCAFIFLALFIFYRGMCVK